MVGIDQSPESYQLMGPKSPDFLRGKNLQTLSTDTVFVKTNISVNVVSPPTVKSL